MALFEEIGGAPAVQAAVEVFYRKMLMDDRVARFFDDTDMRRQIAKQGAFLTMAFGGPNNYTGKDLREGHRPMVDKGLDDLHVDVATDAEAGWIFVSDNMTTHVSESLVRYVAEACEITNDLGVKGKSGLLKSVATRRVFLTETSHRIRFVSVPKHTSWLNQIEIWFSILVRRVIRRGHFTSTADLREKILTFIEYFNRTLAKPYKWTFTSRPLDV